MCGRNTNNADACAQKSIDSLNPYLRKGIPELGVPSIDPMFLEKVPLANIPDFRTIATNCSLRGLADYNLTSFKINTANQTMTGKLIFKKMNFDADLQVDAKIIVPINQKGYMTSETGDYYYYYSIDVLESQGVYVIKILMFDVEHPFQKYKF